MNKKHKNKQKYKRDWDDHSDQSNEDFMDDIMPSDEDFLIAYPVLRLTKEQIEELYTDINNKMVNGLCKTAENRSYPTISRRWGESSTTKDKHGKQKTQRQQITWTMSHIVKIWNDDRPKVIGLEVSHLCHTPSCCTNEHLIWEYHGRNMKRNACYTKGKCICNFKEKCIFNKHI